MKALWQALDGREFIIVGKDIDEIKEKIAEKRKELGLETPDVLFAKTDDPSLLKSKEPVMDFNDLDQETKELVVKGLEQQQNLVNNKKAN